MKKLLLALLLLAVPAAAHAETQASIREADLKSALEVLKASHAGEISTSSRFLNLGLRLGGSGLALTSVGVSLIALESSGRIAETAAFRLVVPTLTTSGMLLVGAGMVTVDIGLIASIFEPRPAQAATLDEHFLSSSEGLREFLALPIEQQLQIARWSRPLQVVSLGLAEEIVREASAQ